jgi:hypothetical protein
LRQSWLSLTIESTIEQMTQMSIPGIGSAARIPGIVSPEIAAQA